MTLSLFLGETRCSWIARISRKTGAKGQISNDLIKECKRITNSVVVIYTNKSVFSSPQGSDGFTGALGPTGEKGKKVSRIYKVIMTLCHKSDISFNFVSLMLSPRVLQDNQEGQARGVQM